MRAPTFWHSLKFAAEGVVHVVRTQRNARIHLIALAAVITAAIAFHLSPLEWAVILLVSGVVIALEALNSAVEALVDLVHPEFHPQAKKVKDAAAAAVLLAAITAVAVGVAVFGPRVWAFLSSGR